MEETSSERQLQMLQVSLPNRKRKTLVDDYLEDIGLRQDELKRQKRIARAATLPEEDKGLVYWEQYCEDHGRDTLPTWDSLESYIVEFVTPLEGQADELRRMDPTISPIRDLLHPVLRLRNQHGGQQQHQRSPPLKQHQPRQQTQPLQSAAVARAVQLPSPLSTRATDSRPDTPEVSTSAIHAAHAKSRREMYEDTDDDFQENDPVDPVAANAAAALKYGDYSQFTAQEFRFLTVGGQVQKYDRNVPSHYRINVEIQAVGDVLQEWRFGYEGEPSVQDLNSKYGGKWRLSQKSLYEMRSMVVMEFVYLVMEEGLSSLQAVQKLVHMQGHRLITRLGKDVKTQRLKRKYQVRKK
ncbi:hypothetical protein EMPS_06814 [Entomortierella parvispora]|uniref:Transcription activator GCR1-like domain-containing protein n=1 Tax=Entomortierella parvispora TaxID=205924 RepID=A0A9P3LXK7_9FUNG|nr:hypothetical protein EMPS_06814 [Entomortierella parvispora]